MTVTAVDTAAGGVMSCDEEKKHFLMEARARECARVLSMALTAVLHNKQALDHFLNGLFRNNPKYGSKDRRRIGDAVFRVFRDYVFLQKLLPEKEEMLKICFSVLPFLPEKKSFPDPGWKSVIFRKNCSLKPRKKKIFLQEWSVFLEKIFP